MGEWPFTFENYRYSKERTPPKRFLSYGVARHVMRVGVEGLGRRRAGGRGEGGGGRGLVCGVHTIEYNRVFFSDDLLLQVVDQSTR